MAVDSMAEATLALAIGVALTPVFMASEDIAITAGIHGRTTGIITPILTYAIALITATIGLRIPAIDERPPRCLQGSFD